MPAFPSRQIALTSGNNAGLPLAAAALQGTSPNAARKDHVHPTRFALGVGAGNAPVSNGDVTVVFTSNTLLTFQAKGSDGTVRSGTVTLA